MNLYFWAAEDGDEIVAIKIGHAFDPEKRRKTLQAGCPYPITPLRVMMCAGHFEHEVHALFAEDRMFGEWFRATPELLDFIRDVQFDLVTSKIIVPGSVKA